MIKKLFEIIVEDKHNSHVSLIKNVVYQELSFLSMENNWTHTLVQFDRIEIKSEPYRRVIYYNVFGHGEPILEYS
jgi:hypothetical protein